MLPVGLGTVRLFLHVLSATIWVGGQLTLAGLVPVLRRAAPAAVAAAARRYARIAWPAFAVLVGTGLWNLYAVRGQLHGAYRGTLEVKLAAVAVSGVAAGVHQRSTTRWMLAGFGALAALASLAALFYGIVLARF